MTDCYPDRHDETIEEGKTGCCKTCRDINPGFSEDHETEDGNCLCYGCLCRKCYWYEDGCCTI